MTSPGITPTNYDFFSLPGAQGNPWGINESRQVIVNNVGGSGRAHLWSPSAGAQDLGTLGGGWADATAINEAGHIVGSSATSSGAGHAFLWRPETGMVDLTPGSACSSAYDINDHGDIVGVDCDAPDGAVLWLAAGGIQHLGTTPDGTQCNPLAINNSRQVLGGCGAAYIWSESTGWQMIPETAGGWGSEGDINDLGQVAGYGNEVPFRWSPVDGYQALELPPGASGRAYGINNLGHVVGFFQMEAQPYPPGPLTGTTERPAIWTDAGLVDLSPIPLPQGATWAQAVNDAGDIVGSGNPLTATMWTPHAGPQLEPYGTTNPGMNVTVAPVMPKTYTPYSPITVTFDVVTLAGITAVRTGDPSEPPPLGEHVEDDRYQDWFGNRPYFSLETTADHIGAITVCYDYASTGYQIAAQLRLFRDAQSVEGGPSSWTDVTTSNDLNAQVVCGSVTSLSPWSGYPQAGIESFALVEVPGSFNTNPGTSVAVAPVDPATNTTPVTLTFDMVTEAGNTTVTSSTTGDPPPLGFALGEPATYYDVQTTATYSGTVALCFSYAPSGYQDPANLRLFHGEGGFWVDVTTSNDVNTGSICGSVTSLSPFVLAELRYHFTGFFQPVDNPGPTNVVNIAKAGSAIPIKFSLGGDFGLDILQGGSPSSAPFTCGSAPADAIEETVAASGSGLQYEDNQYVYVWKTEGGWKGSCRRFTLTLRDGQSFVALFKFK
jgi:probable HAF family extracellular repeat protein